MRTEIQLYSPHLTNQSSQPFNRSAAHPQLVSIFNSPVLVGAAGGDEDTCGDRHPAGTGQSPSIPLLTSSNSRRG